ncbi:MAG: hypothetical protein UR27_C0010G0051 [Candidatus Peregrinibacteria bacterium GW2011_GWA2_33_10]|nr:MAG: hypothetical protein UR27_C0010G0051 [Candidatus Peregrinibacteria bacterium GW2011_GWA2_33_10]KKP41239.1 MAG: hypothetical protein UR30_C0001G0086 [Candidatus Peregrinibacteria bacterium GW2011_GWC2_33_13]
MKPNLFACKFITSALVIFALLLTGCGKAAEEETKNAATDKNTSTKNTNVKNNDSDKKEVDVVLAPSPEAVVSDLDSAKSAKTKGDCDKINDPDYKERCYLELQD